MFIYIYLYTYTCTYLFNRERGGCLSAVRPPTVRRLSVSCLPGMPCTNFGSTHLVNRLAPARRRAVDTAERPCCSCHATHGSMGAL